MCLQRETLGQRGFALMLSLFLLRSTRRTVKKSLLEEVQELEARAVDPGAAVLRDASGRRYIQCLQRISQCHQQSYPLLSIHLFHWFLPHLC